MKKFLLTLTFVVLGTVAHAQVGEVPSSLDATATVVPALQVAPTNFSFGNIVIGTTATVGITSGSAGVFDITASGNTPLNITLTTENLALNTDANTTLAVTWTAGSATTGTAGDAIAFGDINSIPELTTSAGGKLYIYVGGTTASAVTAGSYTATVDLTVSYN